MEFNKLVFAGLSVGCLAAAAGGSFLAVRQNQTSAYALPETSELRPEAAATDQKAPAAVTESEGVIAPEAPKTESLSPEAPPAPARRSPVATTPATSSRSAR